MILLLDAGNTRIKWSWLRDGLSSPPRACPHRDLSPLTTEYLAHRPQHILACNVAGEAIQYKLEHALRRQPIRWITPTAYGGGIRNGYQDPKRLGPDRWAAAIGAAHYWPKEDCLVVCAGTALTVDRLRAEGLFEGGSISPGLQLMRQSLDSGTARLGRPDGQWKAAPTNTADAITTGCINALTGSIQKAAEVFAADIGHPPRILLSGGDARLLGQYLLGQVMTVDNLVLAGLAILSADPLPKDEDE